MSDKVRELAARLGALHGDCRDSSADAFGATVDQILRAALEPLLGKSAKVCEDSEQYDFGETMSLSTDDVKALAAELKGWTRQNHDRIGAK